MAHAPQVIDPDSGNEDSGQSSVQGTWLVLALAVWAGLSLGHGTGLDIVSLGVKWIQLPGSVSDAGGQVGFLIGERILAATLGLTAVVILFLMVNKAASFGALALGSLIPAWILCGALGLLAWKLIIIYTTELVHFAQYALVGALFSIALGRGRRPQFAFVVVFFLGMLDEVWQHYGLHVWLLEEQTHYLDWSDPFLNGIGAFAGVLPAACWLRLRECGTTQMHVIYASAGIAVIVLFPLLLLDPATLSSWFGSYPYYPFWDEHTNFKPVHWVTPYEGIPLIPAFLLLVGSVLDPVRRATSVMVLAICGLLFGIAIQPLSRTNGTIVHEKVPHALVMPVAEDVITIDGHAEEPVWDQATRLGPFRDNLSGGALAPTCRDQPALPRTEARVLWSTQALYLSLSVRDEDVWARQLERDSPGVLRDEGIRIMIDDGGEEVLFYEVDLSPANGLVDMLQLVASAPIDFEPWSPTLGWRHFDAPQITSAVHVEGSLEMVSSPQVPIVSAPDSGYTVEVRVPWSVFRTSSSPSSNSAHIALPPKPSDRWRLGLYRLETPRPSTELAQSVSVEDAQMQLGVSTSQWPALMEERDWTVDAQGRLPGSQVWGEIARRCGRLQAWSPTFLDLRRPSHFGVIEFSPPPSLH
ncbi:MAG: carbohydrate-binding family 9-like protein [Gemmatimonadetes bacterium]|jgi:hypothetical protein|nr:carbohydrate-binding family 9-like protein [Gemmatimonadota bacterium]MBT5141776.1 carbohydrate-binding family 9-like protein [Gemmatimonadota bacterium]MBT5962855.1 carbohydrate-binding family 9-like protein [Gemmatimonadota bacterium]MBT6629775.1 carbohydrate-binding family 9-like protein [Gemmatimonadota bacterium]MBT7453861.1 carbohydrate-binding family 9-like protein [Gemmatimonadota bacterium]